MILIAHPVVWSSMKRQTAPLSRAVSISVSARRAVTGHVPQALQADLRRMAGMRQALELQHAQDRAHLDEFHARSLQNNAPQSAAAADRVCS